VPNSPAWWQENIYPEDKDAALTAFYAHVGVDRAPYDMNVRYYHRNGSTVWVRCRGLARFNDQGVPVRMLGAHNDITSLMQAQEELKAQLLMRDQALEVLTTTALDGYFDWDIPSGREYLSDRWKQSLGYDPDEIENTHAAWERLLHPDDVAKAQLAIQQHLDNGEPYNIVLRYRKKTGDWTYMRAQGVAQRHPVTGESVHMFGTHTDVTDLFAARDQAKSANLAKSTFLATMSHEIRTPLNCLLGMAQSLMASSLTDEQREDLLTLQNAGTHLLSLVNDLLDFSRIEAGHLVLEKETFNIQETVTSVLDVQLGDADRKGIELIYDTKIPPGSRFEGDSDRVRQIVFNLVGNALKFTDEGSIEVLLEPEERDAIIGVAIHVTDTGIGMTADQQKDIFADFTQADSGTRRKYGGSGLGLSICKKLVNAMKGTMAVQSDSNRGSKFSVWIPGLTIAHSNEVISWCSPLDPIDMYQAEGTHLLARCLERLGCVVRRYQREDEFLSAIADNKSFVVLGRKSAQNAKLMELLAQKKDSIRIIVVGRCSRAILGTFPADHRPLVLPHFPTSDEVLSALSGRILLCRHVDDTAADLIGNTTDEPLRVLIAEDNRVNQKVLLRLLSRLPCTSTIVSDGSEAVKACEQRQFDLILMDYCM
jgi:PAS domain S-box-containing protein